MRRVCVFCGSQLGSKPAYLEAARRMGESLARRKLGLVYGGASVGLMGAVADAALAAGGEVIGVLPGPLQKKELAHAGLTRLHLVGSMHERKAKMASLADAFVALPGGLGTLEELAEVLTWAQLGLHRKPCALLDVDGYFAPLLTFLDRAVAERFVAPAHRAMILVDRDPKQLLDALAAWRAPAVEKWLDRDAT